LFVLWYYFTVIEVTLHWTIWLTMWMKHVYLMSFSEHKGNHVVISEDKDELSVEIKQNTL
jgi:hypothetical protein